MSGRFGLNGSLREARSTWSGNASFVRSASLQNETGQTGTTLVLAFTNAASVTGTYTYALTERWSLGATVGAYSNRYDGVETDARRCPTITATTPVGNVGYAYSDRTQFNVHGRVLRTIISDLTHSNEVTTTIGAVHQFSPQLTISASVGAFWSDTTVAQSDLPASGGNQRRDSGELYGGSISYAVSERTQFGANLSENLAPSSSGTLNKTDNADAWLTHQFSDRLTGRLGANYSRTTVPVTISSSITNNDYSGEIGCFLPARRALEARRRLPVRERTLRKYRRSARCRCAQIECRLRKHRLQLARRLVHGLGGAAYRCRRGCPGPVHVSLPERSSGPTTTQGAPPEGRSPGSLTVRSVYDPVGHLCVAGRI